MNLIKRLLNTIKSIGVLNMLEEDLLSLLKDQVYVKEPRGIIALLRSINDDIFQLPELKEVIFLFHGYVVIAMKADGSYSFLITPGIFEEYELIDVVSIDECDFHFFSNGGFGKKIAIACYTEDINSLSNVLSSLLSLLAL